MPQGYSPQIMSRAKELWEKDSTASYETVAKLVNSEFGVRITRKTLHQWSQMYGWAQGVAVEEKSVVPFVGPTTLPVSISSEDQEEFDWDKKRMAFLLKLSGVAENCLHMEPGEPMRFRDDDSRMRTGMAAVELLGKINSGKFDPAENGDRVPQLDQKKADAIINFFVIQGSPEPHLDKVIDIRPEGSDEDSN